MQVYIDWHNQCEKYSNLVWFGFGAVFVFFPIIYSFHRTLFVEKSIHKHHIHIALLLFDLDTTGKKNGGKYKWWFDIWLIQQQTRNIVIDRYRLNFVMIRSHRICFRKLFQYWIAAAMHRRRFLNWNTHQRNIHTHTHKWPDRKRPSNCVREVRRET